MDPAVSKSTIVRINQTCDKTLKSHTGCVIGLTVGPDGTLYSASSDNTIKVWNTSNGTSVKTL